ncbi:uncharacterized protein LOC122498575 [Leptopilina heterotoma]|uniref:uncharacterized protein LOC122498575 n=1 Tax=Leptopilina heterotoma TaxID=63436 RepID=UPI001CA8473F|nr:uncharacterized protein LOC122498575 [Leptopilina heterotoma]XP_043462315.1 uncharacterized protein LOC122498575 [Leptopilina heterotoma]
MIYSVGKSKTGTCLPIAFALFLINNHCVNAISVPVVSFEIEDPKVLENMESVTDQREIIIDAKVQNQKSNENTKTHLLLKRRSRRGMSDYMTPCHFKICNLASNLIVDSKESENRESYQNNQNLPNQTRAETILSKSRDAVSQEGQESHFLQKRVIRPFTNNQHRSFDYMHPCHFKICNMGR